MFKICSNELDVRLAELINHAFETSQFPEDMTKAGIYPIFKKNMI